MIQAHPVSSEFDLNKGPGRYRIGLIALASDYVTKRDFMNMRPSDEVAIYTSRILNANVYSGESSYYGPSGFRRRIVNSSTRITGCRGI